MHGLPYDQLERYLAAVEVIQTLRSEKSIAAHSRILDLGGYAKNGSGKVIPPLATLLPQASITTADIIDYSDPYYIRLEPEKPFPFTDGNFSVVVCMDVLEHIPDYQREAFIAEALRVTDSVMVLGAPFRNPQREAADRFLNDFSKAVLNTSIPMLDEHLAFGLPSPETFERYVKSKGLAFYRFENGDLAPWRLWNCLKLILSQIVSAEELERAEARLYPFARPVCASGDSYRDIYLISKAGPGLIKPVQSRLEQLSGSTVTCPGEYSSFETAYTANLELVGKHLLQPERADERASEKENQAPNQWDDVQPYTRRIRNLEAEISELNKCLNLAEVEANAVRHTRSYRLGRFILLPGIWLNQILNRKGLQSTFRNPFGHNKPGLTTEEKASLLGKYGHMRVRPFFSLLIPVFNTDGHILRATLESVFNQMYGEWELCLADDGSTKPETRKVIEEFSARDRKRVKSVFLNNNSGIAAASNAAAELASGDYIGLLDHDDLLTEDALLQMALRINEEPDADLVYSDEDKLSEDGSFKYPFHKPDFSPELFLSHNYLCHFTVIRASIFREVGGFRHGYEGSQDYDLFLRVAEKAKVIEHVPRILYHWRMISGSTAAHVGEKGGLWRESSRAALSAAIERRGLEAEVLNGIAPGSYRVKYEVDTTKGVTIIIPTKDHVDILKPCIQSVIRHTRYANYEILVISNNSEEPETYAYLEEAQENGLIRYLKHDIPFNYSSLNNFAVSRCESPYLLFLNNDVEVICDGWLTSMMEYAQQKEIGAVGAKLLFPDRKIQHAGVVLGVGGVAGHSHKYFKENDYGYFSALSAARNYSAVTGACLLTRRDVFYEVGQFDESLAVNYNDIDLCLKIRAAGYRIVYTPYSQLIHYESKSRVKKVSFRESVYMQTRWKDTLYTDPYYNPNLTLCREDFSLKTPGDRLKERKFKAVAFNK